MVQGSRFKVQGKKLVVVIAISLICLILPQTSQAATTSQISQWGITWTFDREYEYGQFANGDYWVIGPVTIIDIDPASIVVVSRTMHGSMVNPDPSLQEGHRQGFDSDAFDWDSSLNVGRPGGNDLDANNPLVVSAGSSLISVQSIEAAQQRPQLQTAAVLTVLTAAPDANSFRPSYSGTDKTIKYNVSDLDYSGLGSLVPVASVPDLATVEGWFERIWIDFLPQDYGRDIHPADNMPEYGQNMSIRIGDGALMLQLNYSNAQKEALMVRYVQLGIDLYGVLTNGEGGRRVWEAAGGHSGGRKWPILFAGLVLDDPNMLAIADKSGDYLYSGEYEAGNVPPDYYYFGEDDQTFYVKAADVYSQPYTLSTYGSAYSTGTVKVTNGSAVVEGVGTSWSGLSVGTYDTFGVVNDVEAYSPTGQPYRVSSIDSNTQITLSVAYRGSTDISGTATYKLAAYCYYGHGEGSKSKDWEEYTNSNLNLPDWGIVHASEPYRDGVDWGKNYQVTSYTGYSSAALAAHIMDEKSLWNHNAFFDYSDRYMGLRTGSINNSDFGEDMWDTYRADYGPIWPEVGEPTIPGDVNSDGEVTAYDAALTARLAVGLDELTAEKLEIAEVSGDAEITAYDAALIAQRAVGLIDKFPIEL